VDKVPGSLSEVIRINNNDPANLAPYGQHYLTGAQNTARTGNKYNALVSSFRSNASGSLSELFKAHNIRAQINK